MYTNTNRDKILEKSKKIAELKYKLQCTDYKAIKFAEGELSDEEYAETKAQRKAWREAIGALEIEIENLKK